MSESAELEEVEVLGGAIGEPDDDKDALRREMIAGAISLLPLSELGQCLFGGCSAQGWGLAAISVFPPVKLVKIAAKGASIASKAAKGLGANPFKGKSFEEIDRLLTGRGFKKVGPDPASGKGSYIHPESGRKYYLDKGGRYREVLNFRMLMFTACANLEQEGKRRYPLGDNLIEPKS